MDTVGVNSIIVVAAILVALFIFLRQRARGKSRSQEIGSDRAYTAPRTFWHDSTQQSVPTPLVPEKSEQELLAEARADLVACITLDECWNVYDRSESGSGIEKDAAEQALQFSRVEIVSSDSIDRCWEIIDLLLNKDLGDSETVMDEAIKRIFAITTTVDEALSLVSGLDARWDEGVDDEIEKALRLAISFVSNSDEAELVYDKCAEGTEVELEVCKRILEYAEDVETCQSFWDHHGIDTNFGELAIVRAAELIKAKDSAPK